MALWYSLGKRCSHTFGSKYIHPADLRRGKEQDDPLEAKRPAMEASAEPLENKLTVDEDTTRKSVNKHRVLASTILTSAKGRRKKYDRPKRHRRWLQEAHAKPLTTAKVKTKKEKTNTTPNLVTVHKLPAATICSPMLNEWDDMTETQSISTQDDTNLKLERMETSFCETKKKSNIATGLLMHIVLKKRLAIHDNQKRFMADCGAWPGDWANVGIIHQHQRDLTRAANRVLAGFYPRDVIKWPPLYFH